MKTWKILGSCRSREIAVQAIALSAVRHSIKYPVHAQDMIDLAEAKSIDRLRHDVMVSYNASYPGATGLPLWNVQRHDILATSDPFTKSSRQMTPTERLVYCGFEESGERRAYIHRQEGNSPPGVCIRYTFQLAAYCSWGCDHPRLGKT